MSETRRGRSSFSDADVDSLLKDFFRREVPHELQPAVQNVAVGPDAMRRRAGWPALSAVAGSLLCVAVLLSQPATQAPDGSAAGIPFAGSAGMEDSQAGRAARLADDSEKQPDTLNGPVEQRMRKVMIFDPETGEQVELLLPELEIEIFPIDDQNSDE